jgi:OmcA/MtrC family decaheme c-type cytochrome
MNVSIRHFRAAPALPLLAALLFGCGDSGGDRAAGVEDGPPPPGGGTPPPAPLPPSGPTTIDVDEITGDNTVAVEIVGIAVASPPAVTFSLAVDGLRVTGLTTGDLRGSLAQLVPEANFDIDSWESYLESPEDPVCRNQADVDSSSNACTSFTTETDPGTIPDDARKVDDPDATGKVATPHATTENSGQLTDNADGTWTYGYATDPGDPLSLTTMHRVCLQFSLNAPADNTCVDYIPADLADPAIGLAATSLTPGFYDVYRSREVVAETSCNSCHAEVAVHGGGRTATSYCVTCHNPGSIDANSENTVDFKVLVHRIHYARNLDSVVGGTPYKIWGFRNGEHNYSHVSYPQNVRNCTRCHAGEEDVAFALEEGLPPPEATITADGFNWASKPNPETCLSCHESAVGHIGERTSCVQCHGPGEFASVQEKHRNLLEEQGRALALNIDAVTSTGAGENPVITFSATRDGVPINVLDSADFDGDIRFRIAWDAATEYLNSGGSTPPISATLSDAVAIGGNQFQIDTAGSTAVPEDIDTLGIHGLLDENTAGGTASARSPDFYAASSSASATPRRQVVADVNCNNCHRRLDQHVPGSRSVTDNPLVCVGCHEPNRQSGRQANSTDFSVLIHGLHASGFREMPYRSWTTERIQFPGDLANCDVCHTGGSHRLPLPLERAPLLDASATEYTTPIAAACGACHDDNLAQAHMESAGGAVFNGDFDTASAAVESCEVCHRTGASADVDVVHAR